MGRVTGHGVTPWKGTGKRYDIEIYDDDPDAYLRYVETR